MTDKLSAPTLNLWLRKACDRAEAWLDTVPRSTEAGLIVDKSGIPINPDFAKLKPSNWKVHKGSVGGVWPTSAEISSAMIRRDEAR